MPGAVVLRLAGNRILRQLKNRSQNLKLKLRQTRKKMVVDGTWPLRARRRNEPLLLLRRLLQAQQQKLLHGESLEARPLAEMLMTSLDPHGMIGRAVPKMSLVLMRGQGIGHGKSQLEAVVAMVALGADS